LFSKSVGKPSQVPRFQFVQPPWDSLGMSSWLGQCARAYLFPELVAMKDGSVAPFFHSKPANFFYKGPDNNFLSFAGNMVSGTTT